MALLGGRGGADVATVADPDDAAADAAVRARIDALRGPAAGIRADGDPTDWAALPHLADPRGDAGDAPALDLVGVAVAPTDAGLHVLLRTAGPPAADAPVYWLDVDAAGAARAELQVGISPDGLHRVRVLDAAAAEPFRRARFAAAVGDEVVEVTLPWDSLEAWSPRTGPAHGPGSRGWVRVVATTWPAGASAVRDAASAASYRLGSAPPALEPPRADGDEAPVARIPLPVEGTWWVSQDARGVLTHRGGHAVDLTVVDEGLQAGPLGGSCRLGDHRAWDRPVVAPRAGRVRAVVSDAPDRSPCRPTPSGAAANEVLLDLGDGLALRFLHLRRGSAAVAPGARVAAGQLLARVGSSGVSSAPHLHVELVAGGGGGPRPFAFEDVTVGLNPGPDDPWTRALTAWTPRAGFFVSPTPHPTR